MLNFDFLGKGMEIVSPSHFVYDFSKKNVSCYALLTDQILLPDCLFFLRYWSICVLQLFVNQVGDVINFEINLSNQVLFLHHRKIKTKTFNAVGLHFLKNLLTR